MGSPSSPPLGILIAGLLASAREQMSQLTGFLSEKWNGVLEESEAVPFDFSNYYLNELGASPVRKFLAWRYLFSPDQMAFLKLHTNALELEFSNSRKRCCNIDPGFVNLHQLVLASTKPASYRIYLGSGIYAQATLHFRAKSFHPWPWTYQDYRRKETIDFFNRVREKYKILLKEETLHGSHSAL